MGKRREDPAEAGLRSEDEAARRLAAAETPARKQRKIAMQKALPGMETEREEEMARKAGEILACQRETDTLRTELTEHENAMADLMEAAGVVIFRAQGYVATITRSRRLKVKRG